MSKPIKAQPPVAKPPVGPSVQTQAQAPTSEPKPPAVLVMLPLFLPRLLTYSWAGAAPPTVGQLVQVEVGKKTYHGLVMERLDTPAEPSAKAAKPAAAPKKLKPANPAGLPILPLPMVNFLRWVGRYTLSAPGEPLRALLLQGQVPPTPAPKKFLCAAPPSHNTQTLNAKQQAVLAAASHTAATSMAELARAAGTSAAVVKTLLNHGLLQWVEEAANSSPHAHQNFQFSLTHLRAEQETATHAIQAAHGTFQPFLLDGITGSGKTEVYFAVLQKLLTQGTSQALILVPEIALTPQWLTRFEKKFGFAPTVWHSGLSPAARQKAWWEVCSGQARVIVGARSALFLPFQHLALAVVDEEHDPAYKQDQKFRYHGRDMAIVLAKLWACPVVLASATPSLESLNNVHAGRYQRLVLKSRHGKAQLPEIHLVDTRGQMAEDYLSPQLRTALQETLQRGEQSLLFLNRRGVAPLLICRTCGHRHDCPNCDASLVAHGSHFNGKLTCHHCGFTEPWPETCPKCGGDKLHPFGPGTRKIFEEVKKAFPAARLAVADSDAITTATQMSTLVQAIQKQQIDILIGTQMVSKGHDFPHLTCVGVLDADMGLAHGDLRAAERTFQMLTQVSGRAGRGEKPGQIFVQTAMPEHPLMQALQKNDREAFYAHEMAERKAWNWPPYCRLVSLTFSSQNAPLALESAQKMAQNFAQFAPAAQVLGPAPHSLFKLNKICRYRLLIKADAPLHEALQAWLAATPLPRQVEVRVDVDPA